MNPIKFHRGGYDNNWEPHPYDASLMECRRQLRRFKKIYRQSILWMSIDYENIPFELTKKAISELEISHFATHKCADYILMDNIWFGFPDPPRWRVAKRLIEPKTGLNLAWQDCGYFSGIPYRWRGIDD